MEHRAREGDFIETADGLIFDVKGMIHPPERIIAFLRYYPEESGKRLKNGIRYKKVYDLEARFDLIRERYPQYLFNDRISGEILQAIPKERIKVIFRPAELVKKLISVDGEEQSERQESYLMLQNALELIRLIKMETNINYEDMGISGSFLVNLDTEQSDIDLVIYGSENAYRVREGLDSLYQSRPEIIQPYSRKNISNLYEFRGKESKIPFEIFLKLEQRKKLQGIFRGADFYIRCIRNWSEIENKYGDIHYKFIGLATIQGIISDDSEAILTPCKYPIDSSKIVHGPKISERIKEIISFRGRFCEQGLTGEEVEARGKLELVRSKNKNYYRLLIGTFKSDYLTVLNI